MLSAALSLACAGCNGDAFLALTGPKGEGPGLLDPGQTVVCTVTGNGLKDPEWAIAGAPTPVSVPVDAVAAATELGLDG